MCEFFTMKEDINWQEICARSLLYEVCTAREFSKSLNEAYMSQGDKNLGGNGVNCFSGLHHVKQRIPC